MGFGSVEIQGIQWPSMVSEESLNAVKQFDVRDDDVWIATWPKAGTHWVAEICQLILNNGDLDKIDRQQKPIPLEFDKMPQENDVSLYKVAPSWTSPRVLVTHVPKRLLPDQLLTSEKAKVITVIRNLKDSLVSYYHFIKGMSPGSTETFEDSLQKNVYAEKVDFTSWFDHVSEYWAERHNKRHLILKYEDMKADTRGAIIQVADFLGRPLEDDVIDKITDLVTVKSMKTRYNKEEVLGPSAQKVGAPKIVRKGIVGDWKTAFTVAQSEALDEFYRQKMAGSSLKMEF